MASCATCNTTIVFGGKKLGEQRFCGDKCLQRAQIALAARQMITEEELRWAVHDKRNGSCPLCRGIGPNDVFVAHRVWSAIRICRWVSEPKISCAPCAKSRHWKGIAFSGFLGWWSVPGLFLTPVQLYRNFRGLGKTEVPPVPSPQLEAMVRDELAAAKIASGAVVRS